MIIKIICNGLIEENAYIYYDINTLNGILIDPGYDADKILKIINSKNIKIQKILITHGHFDHIGALNEINKYLKVPIYAYNNYYLNNTKYNLSSLYGLNIRYDKKINNIKDGDLIKLDSINLKVLHTKGHTNDSLCFLDENKLILFSGDTLFKNGYGRIDFPGGNIDEMNKSIKLLMSLNENIVVYPGHGENTKILNEKENYR